MIHLYANASPLLLSTQHATIINSIFFFYTFGVIAFILLIVFVIRTLALKKELIKNKNALEEKQTETENLSREIEKRTRSIEKALEKAEEANRLKSLFLSNMSHEIRTPLNGIVGFAELITDPDIDQKTKKMFSRQINFNSDQLLKLIDQIFHLAIFETGKVTIERSSFNVSDLIHSIVPKIQEKIKLLSKNIKLSINIESKDFEIKTDNDKLRVIIENLFDNALKFTETGIIEFSCLRLENDFLFEISDSGCGLREDEYEIIFEPFFQGYDVIKNIKGGSGLGLSNVKNYVVLLGGKIWCKKNKPQGSIFSFTLPAPRIRETDIFRYLQHMSKN